MMPNVAIYIQEKPEKALKKKVRNMESNMASWQPRYLG